VIIAQFTAALREYFCSYERTQKLADFPVLGKQQQNHHQQSRAPLTEHNVCQIKKAFPEKFSPIPPHYTITGQHNKKPQSSSPMRPITKQRALTFENNNLSDFITKKKPKKKSIIMRRVATNQTLPPSTQGCQITNCEDPFAVAETHKKTDLDEERRALKELRMLKSSPKKTKKCPNQECPFRSVPDQLDPSNVVFDDDTIQLAERISRLYATFTMTPTLVHDHRLMLFLLSNGASDEQGSIYALVLLVMARNATHAFPRGVFAPCVLLFLQTRFDLINSMSNLTIASLKHDLANHSLSTPSTTQQIKLTGSYFNATQFDAHQLQKRDFFTSQGQLAQFRKQRDEFHSLLRAWQANHGNEHFRTDLELGGRIRSLIHQIGHHGTAVAFARLFIGLLVDTFYEQTNATATPSPDSTLEGSQLDLFELMSQLDISSFMRSSNAKKIALLEQRINKSQHQSTSKKELKSGLFPGVQSFFHDFLVIGSCARLHANVVDVLFESMRLVMGQVSEINPDRADGEISARQVLLEGQVLSLLSKFAGFVHFYPYATVATLKQLSPARVVTCPIDFSTQLIRVSSNQCAFIITLNAVCEFVRQSQHTHCLDEFVGLLPVIAAIRKQLHSGSTLGGHARLLIALKCHQITAVLPHITSTAIAEFELKLNNDINLTGQDLVHLESNLGLINTPVKLGDDVKGNTTSMSSPVASNKSMNKPKAELSMEEAFFRSHPSSLRRTVDFVTERVVSNCVKNFRTSVIPHMLRQVNAELKDKFQGKTKEQLESQATVDLIASTVATTKEQCLSACIEKSANFIGTDVIPTLTYLFSRDIDQSVVSISARVVTRDARTKTEQWFREHTPSIIDRDGKSAFERSRNRAILASGGETGVELVKTQNQMGILSYIPLDMLRKCILRGDLDELYNAVKLVLSNATCYNENEAVQRSVGLLVSHGVHMLIAHQQADFLTEKALFSFLQIPIELFLMACFVERYEPGSDATKQLVEVVQCQYHMSKTNATTSLTDSLDAI